MTLSASTAPASPGAISFQATGMAMKPHLSIYLDLVRLGAALVVCASHYGPVLFGASEHLFPGHDAVVVFFVLSGFVIGHATSRPGATPASYAADRLSRLWSVTGPALLIGIVAFVTLGRTSLPVAPAATDAWDLLRRTAISFVFLGESWADTTAPYNGAMWSLNYEAWYYALFGVWLLPRSRWRTAALAGAALLAGPRILTLLPCWLAGLLLQRNLHRVRLGRGWAAVLLMITLAAYAAAYEGELTLHSRAWLVALTRGQSYHVGPSSSVIGDLLLTVVIAANFAAIAALAPPERLVRTVRRPIQAAAANTFSLYLLHMPVLAVLVGLGCPVRWEAGSAFTAVAAAALVVGAGMYAERQRPAWRFWIIRLGQLTAAGTAWVRTIAPFRRLSA